MTEISSVDITTKLATVAGDKKLISDWSSTATVQPTLKIGQVDFEIIRPTGNVKK